MPQSFTPFVLVGVGGMAGSVARYGVTLLGQFISTAFPYGTLTVNLLGCFIIGLIAELAAETTLISPEMRLLLATGFCGGFTTFSSFMFEVMGLVRDGELLYASTYVGISAVGGFLLLYFGMQLAKLWS